MQRAFLATPSYSGVSSPYQYSLMLSVPFLWKRGISVDWMHLEGNCHVDDARNDLVRQFLESDCTDLVFIDADVGWRPQDLVDLLSYQRDVVAGIYPKKGGGEDYPAVLPAGENWSDADGLLLAELVPTGFLRFTRMAMQRLYDAEPRRYLGKNDLPDRLPQAIIFERTYRDKRRISGDYSACNKWRELGGTIYVAPEMQLIHQGRREVSGSYGSYLRRERGLALAGLRELRNGGSSMDTILSLYQDWANPGFTARPELLYALSLMGREVQGPILETGSGLSTLILAASSGQPVHALEHSPIWASYTRGQAQKHGLENVHIHYCPLRSYGDFDWYDIQTVLPERFDMALCDGPPRDKVRGWRKGLMEVLGNRLAPGSLVVMDDANDPAQVELARSWFGPEFHILGSDPFIVARSPL